MAIFDVLPRASAALLLGHLGLALADGLAGLLETLKYSVRYF
jgi:hypothetical protein